MKRAVIIVLLLQITHKCLSNDTADNISESEIIINNNEQNFKSDDDSRDKTNDDEHNEVVNEHNNILELIGNDTENVTFNLSSQSSSAPSSVSSTSLRTEMMTKVNCTSVLLINGTSNSTENNTPTIVSSVKLVNSTILTEYLQPPLVSSNNTNVTSSSPSSPSSMGGHCALVMFYYQWCPFSAAAAPHFNALGRLFPQFHVLAIDAYGYNSLNMRYGLVGVPTILIFHSGKIVGKFNDTDPSLESMIAYINLLTGQTPVSEPIVTDEDRDGPVSSIPQPKMDFVLLFSWLFCLCVSFYMFSKSSLYKTIVETVRNNWREAEAQHEHMD